jgi:hypothetical protein
VIHLGNHIQSQQKLGDCKKYYRATAKNYYRATAKNYYRATAKNYYRL